MNIKKTIQSLKEKAGEKLNSPGGMTLAELLCAVLILLLVSAGMVSGVSMAQRQYLKSIQNSQAQELYATLEAILANELRYTTQVVLKAEDSGEVKTFYSVTYARKETDTALVALNQEGKETDYGELALGYQGKYNKLLSSSAYPNGLGAQAKISYDKDQRLFTVTMTIAADNRQLIRKKEFQVRSLNDVTVKNDVGISDL